MLSIPEIRRNLHDGSVCARSTLPRSTYMPARLMISTAVQPPCAARADDMYSRVCATSRSSHFLSFFSKTECLPLMPRAPKDGYELAMFCLPWSLGSETNMLNAWLVLRLQNIEERSMVPASLPRRNTLHRICERVRVLVGGTNPLHARSLDIFLVYDILGLCRKNDATFPWPLNQKWRISMPCFSRG